MRIYALAAILLALISQAAAGSNAIVPDTTLTAQTSNNTSAADSFTTQTNGNLGASNISKVATNSLLYAGSTTHIYAHFMPWFGGANHMNVGYSSDDPTQVAKQVTDMMSRGISGAIIDWYGPNASRENTTAILMMQQAQLENGAFSFAVMEDQGALSGCGDCTGQLISDLNYAYQTFEGSPAYMRINGQPVVFFFDVDNYPINWATVAAGVPGNPLFIFRNAGGFSHTDTGGSYSWVIIDTSNANDWNQSYLDGFYSAGLGSSSEHTFGTGYKGFNDNLAAWTAHRVMNQNCASTWLATLKEIGSFYSPSKQLESLQLVTWNDYEEGSEIETGIDGCTSVSGSAAANSLAWSTTGSESTVDHYQIYISADGQNLMSLTTVPAGTHALDLGQFGVSNGTYSVYVQAVGKPSVKNQISSAISYVAAGGGGGGTNIAVAASPSSLTITRGQPGNYSVTVGPVSGTLSGTVTLSCAGLPSGASCAFNPAQLTPGSSPASSTLTVSTAGMVATNQRRPAILAAFSFPGIGVLGFVLMGDKRRRRIKGACLGFALFGMLMILAACGSAGKSAVQQATPPGSTSGTYAIQVLATDGTMQQATTVTLIVN